MSVQETTLKIPKAIGTNNLVETFGKINLSADVKDFLTSIGGKIVASYSPAGEKPEIEILDRKGAVVCSVDEFVKLGGFRRWVNDELKRLEKERASEQKIELMCLFVRRAVADGTSLDARMDEGNEARFRGFYAFVKAVEENLEKIESTIDNDAKTYLTVKGRHLIGIYYKLMLKCLEPDTLAKGSLEDLLWENGVPKWLHAKMTDKNFSANLKADSIVLLFPRGNYTKAISLSKKELKDEGFLASNKFILKTSGSIIAFSRHNFAGILPDVPGALSDEIKEFIDLHGWILNHPYEPNEILTARINGKSIPSFKARQKPNPTGRNARPETESQRIKREIYNTLTGFNVAWLHMQNFVIPVENPKDQFWSTLIGTGDQWDITPTHNLYQNLEGFNTNLTPIRTLSNAVLNRLMVSIALMAIKVPTTSVGGTAVLKIGTKLANRAGYADRGGVPITDHDTRLNVDVKTMGQTQVPKTIKDQTVTFLGGNTSGTSSKKTRKQGSAVRLSTDVLDELKIIENHALYESVKTWLASSFKSRNRQLLQLTAAERIAGEVLKYQDEILGDDFDEYDYLLEMEGDEDD